MVDIEIVIVSYNVRDLLESCLHSVEGARGRLQCTVTVVDNASTDGTREMLRSEFSGVKLLANSCNVGFAAANNQAIELNNAPYVLLLNPDTVITSDALHRIYQAINDLPTFGVLGPRIVNRDGSLQSSVRPFPNLISLIAEPFAFSCSARQGTSVIETDWILGACMIVRREMIADIGLMDTGYFLFNEEMDWCFRAKQAGWKVGVVMDAELVHLGGQSTKQCAPVAYQHFIAGKARFLSKFYPPQYRTVFLGATLAEAGAKECAAHVLSWALGHRRVEWRRRAEAYSAGRKCAWKLLVGG